KSLTPPPHTHTQKSYWITPFKKKKKNITTNGIIMVNLLLKYKYTHYKSFSTNSSIRNLCSKTLKNISLNQKMPLLLEK
uniref:Uncharacterized protein n=1 Tax=Latimeria chalumnae TaxID=7897 RepID=H3AX51_LATCH